MSQSIDYGIQTLVESAINNLVVDPGWITKIETLVNRAMTDRISQRLATIDMNSVLVDHMDKGIDRWQDRMLQKFKTHFYVYREIIVKMSRTCPSARRGSLLSYRR